MHWNTKEINHKINTGASIKGLPLLVENVPQLLCCSKWTFPHSCGPLQGLKEPQGLDSVWFTKQLPSGHQRYARREAASAKLPGCTIFTQEMEQKITSALVQEVNSDSVTLGGWVKEWYNRAKEGKRGGTKALQHPWKRSSPMAVEWKGQLDTGWEMGRGQEEDRTKHTERSSGTPTLWICGSNVCSEHYHTTADWALFYTHTQEKTTHSPRCLAPHSGAETKMGAEVTGVESRQRLFPSLSSLAKFLEIDSGYVRLLSFGS